MDIFYQLGENVVSIPVQYLLGYVDTANEDRRQLNESSRIENHVTFV